MPKKKITLRTVFRTLDRLYDPPRSFLRYRTPFQLLIAVILSAQCTDVQVNKVTKKLFQKYKKLQDYLSVTQGQLEKEIHSTGFFRSKARNIRSLCNLLLKEHHGKVPQTLEELVHLPGVGRKTAAIVLYVAFGKTEGIAVDTHVARLAQRLGFTRSHDPKRIEQDLMEQLPKKHWGRLNPLLISHGRAICIARHPRCEKCVFQKECPSSTVMKRRDKARKV